MTRFTLIPILLIWFSYTAFCQQQKKDSIQSTANEHMLQNSHEDLAKIFDSSERDEWQNPDELIKYLGEIENKTIVDVGSGSGYFTFRLVNAGARVIAADIDREFLNIIEEKKTKFEIDEEKLRTVQISEDGLDIDSNSADIIFLVNVYHHISNRVNYFSKVNSTLNENGKIVIVDFYKTNLPIGPSKNHKISKDEVIKELNQAGYENLILETDLLEYQYIITAHKY